MGQSELFRTLAIMVLIGRFHCGTRHDQSAARYASRT